MNSALKPILAQAGVPQPSGQASPAKGNVAGVNHAGHPQGAQGSLPAPVVPGAAPQAPAAALQAPGAAPQAPGPALHAPVPAPVVPGPAALAPGPAPHVPGPTNNIVQNLVQHPANAAPLLPHATPHMAPITADMAQMAQNMSHHGNLSHVSQNSVTPANIAASPSKSASTSSPLSLVADKPTPSLPLALTRTPEKKEVETPGQANGTVDSPKPAANSPSPLKPQSNDANKDQELPKTPSKPVENAAKPPSTPQKTEAANAVGQADIPGQAKVVPVSKAPEKSPAKPEPKQEAKPVPTADVAPPRNDNKPPETAKVKADKTPEKAAVPPTPKLEPAIAEKAKTESPPKPEPKKPEPKVEKPATVVSEPKKVEAKPVDSTDGPKKDVKVEPEKSEPKVEVKKPVETPKAVKPEARAPKSTLKLATVNTPIRKRRQTSPIKGADGPSPAKKAAASESTPDNRSKRNRTQVQLYQSPTPELAMATKLSAASGRATPPRQADDKLIVFYKNEYLAVRNAEGGFYVCQALQNVYRATRKIKIRWLSQDQGDVYKPDFYDVTDMECVLTTLSLSKAPGGGGAQLLQAAEAARAASILRRALLAEAGQRPHELTEEHPDGLDLSLYKDESQLEKKLKRKGAKSSPRAKSDADDSPVSAKSAAPLKRSQRGRAAPPAPGPPGAPAPAPAPRKAGSKAPSKTAVADKPSPKPSKTPAKRTAKQAKLTPAKSEPPAKTPAKGRRAAKESRPSPAPTPSTSTGKTTRTPRKPPAHKQ